MPRQLLFSEYTLLQTLLTEPYEFDQADFQVVEEFFSPPRTEGLQWFNTDFFLEFIAPLPPKGKRSGGAFPIRRHSMGAELFLLIDEVGKPASIELLAGETFPKLSYDPEIQLVENAICSTGLSGWATKFREAPFLRVFDLESCVIFLASTATDISHFAASTASKHITKQHEIHVTNDYNQHDMIEGVIYR